MILVYDITQRKTFHNLDSWLEELDRYGGDKMVKVVVGNKRDQVRVLVILRFLLFSLQIHKRKVGYDEGKDWADQRGFLFTETSARDRSNVEAVFHQLVERMLQEPDMWNRVAEDGGHHILRTVGVGGSRGRSDRGGQCCIRVE